MDIVRKLNDEISSVSLDNDKIGTVYVKLLYDNRDRDCAIGDLTALVKGNLDASLGKPPQSRAFQPHHPLGTDRWEW